MDQDVRRLGRAELIEIIYQLQKSEQALQKRVQSLEAELEQRNLRVNKAGTLADAAAAVTDLLATAQQTADVYLDEIRRRHSLADAEYNRVIGMAQKQAEALLQDAMRQRDALDQQCRAARSELRRMEQAAQLMRSGNTVNRLNRGNRE